MVDSVHLCICGGNTQFYHRHVNKYLLTFTMLAGLGDCIYEGAPEGAVSFGSVFISMPFIAKEIMVMVEKFCHTARLNFL